MDDPIVCFITRTNVSPGMKQCNRAYKSSFVRAPPLRSSIESLGIKHRGKRSTDIEWSREPSGKLADEIWTNIQDANSPTFLPDQIYGFRETTRMRGSRPRDIRHVSSAPRSRARGALVCKTLKSQHAVLLLLTDRTSKLRRHGDQEESIDDCAADDQHGDRSCCT